MLKRRVDDMKRKELALIVMFLLAPFGVISMGLVHIGHIYFICVSSFIIAAFMIKNDFITGFFLYAGLWQIYFFVKLMITPGFPPVVVSNGFTVILMFLVWASIYLAVSRSNISTETLFDMICLAAVIQAGIAIVQAFKVDLFLIVMSWVVPTRSKLPLGMVSGTLGNPNFLGAFLAISMPFFFRKRVIYFLPVVLIALIVSRSSSAIIPAVIGVGFYLWLVKRISTEQLTFLGTVLLVSAAVYTMFINDNLIASARWIFWREAILQVSTTWGGMIFGLGTGAVWAEKWPLHSEWVSLFHQYGMVGVAIISGYIVSVFAKLKDPILLASFAIIALNVLGNSALHYAPSAFLICIVLGLIERTATNGRLSDV